MFVIDSRDSLIFAREHAVRLRYDAASAVTRRASPKRHPVGLWLRRHACRCSAPLAHHSA